MKAKVGFDDRIQLEPDGYLESKWLKEKVQASGIRPNVCGYITVKAFVCEQYLIVDLDEIKAFEEFPEGQDV